MIFQLALRQVWYFYRRPNSFLGTHNFQAKVLADREPDFLIITYQAEERQGRFWLILDSTDSSPAPRHAAYFIRYLTYSENSP